MGKKSQSLTHLALEAMRKRKDPFSAGEIKAEVEKDVGEVSYSNVMGAIRAGILRGWITYHGKGIPKKSTRLVKLYSWIGDSGSLVSKKRQEELIELSSGVNELAAKLNESTEVIKEQSERIESLKNHYLRIISEKDKAIAMLQEALTKANVDVGFDISEVVQLKGE